MRRGLVELGRLADMERSVLEQGEEIGALEDKVRRQEGVLRGLGGRARGVGVGLGG